ncbi:hypothetical protein PENSPDRAFT_653682 [Peniophora sp. CONT]|nr:hypothetical protein PENSPDRAFT_653682 [Peniophora sp. CONT]
MANTPPFSTLSYSTHVWIDRLPNELLSEIFLCVHDLVGTERTDEPLYGAPPCTFLSQVCHRWRSVAIACQHLWALFPRVGREWTKACVTRAHSVPVDLRFDVWQPTPSLRKTRRLALPAIPRAETITLYAELDRYEEARRDATEVLRGLAAHVAPRLEELKITLDQNFTWEEYQPTPVPSLFKDETPPRLSMLDLDGCLIESPRSIMSPSLTDITLSNSCIWSDVNDMIQFFQHIPLLESFTFNYPSNDEHGFRTEPSQTHPLRCVSLPRLNYFNVEASFDAGLRIFSYIAFSPDATVIFRPSDCESSTRSRYTDAELENLMTSAGSAVRAHFQEDIEQEICYESVDISHATISGLGCHLGIPGGLRDVPHLRAAAAAMYLTIPVFANTTRLTLNEDMECIVMSDLACCKNIKRLHLHGVAPVLLDAALHDGDVAVNELFPQCAILFIQGFDFVGWPGTSVYDCQVPDAFDKRLAKALRAWRERVRKPIDLVLRECALEPATAAIFESALGANHVRVA